MFNILGYYYYIDSELRRDEAQEKIKKLEKEAKELKRKIEEMRKEKKDNDKVYRMEIF